MAKRGPLRLRNDEHGYGLVTKSLHWTVVAAMAAQFAVGWTMDAGGHGRGRGRGRGEGSGHGRGRGGDLDLELFGEDGVFRGGFLSGEDALLQLHVVLGLTILALAIVRLAWRIATPLPPWAPTLSPCERTLAHWNERLLYVCMFAVPLSGLAIVAAGDDDLVALHVATHVVFWVALAGHVGLVLAHQLLHRDRLLRRMT